MLEVKVFGGLGNQMFQYAFYRYLSQTNTDVQLNISDYKIHKHHHGFELERVFGLNGPYNNQESNLAIHANNVFVRGLKKIFQAEIIKKSEYYEHKEVSFVQSSTINSDVYFVGFWQDIRYTSPVRNRLLEDFTFKELDKRNKEFMEAVKDRETVSIHIRRGDYLKSASLGIVCGEKYYRDAIHYINEHIDRPLFIFFSDDIEWCKEKFGDLDAKFVEWNINDDSYRDMQLMSMCKNNIIANSSFSWWGAYLNEHANITICPRLWNATYKINRLICDQWIAL